MYARKRDRQRKQMKNGKENDPMEYILEQLEEIDEGQFHYHQMISLLYGVHS